MTILVLCHGNINRSPLCAALLRQLLPGRAIESAGLRSDAGGERATRKLRRYVDARLEEEHDPVLVEVARELETHRSQPVTVELLDRAERIVLMDMGNLRRLVLFIERDIATPALESPTTTWNGSPLIHLGHHHNPPLPSLRDPNFIANSSPDLYKAFRAVEEATRNLARELQQ